MIALETISRPHSLIEGPLGLGSSPNDWKILLFIKMLLLLLSFF